MSQVTTDNYLWRRQKKGLEDREEEVGGGRRGVGGGRRRGRRRGYRGRKVEGAVGRMGAGDGRREKKWTVGGRRQFPVHPHKYRLLVTSILVMSFCS